MSLHSWLQKVRSLLTSSRGQRHRRRRDSLRAATYRPYLEALEDRCLPSFSPVMSYAVGTNPNALVTADFNNDGRPDLATANFDDDTLSVLLGNADGTFQPAQTSAVGPYTRTLAAGDFNNDGNLDLAMVIKGGVGDIEISMLLGHGDGTFAAGITQTLGYYPALYVATGDLNADGKLDLVATLENDLSYAEHVSVLLGRGDGSFTLAATYGPYSGWPGPLSLADVNSDGKTDVVVTGETASLRVFLGRGDGTLQDPGVFSVTGGDNNVAIGDFNGDGKLDLATDYGEVLLGNGDGTFQAAQTFAAPGSSVTAGDFNGDGVLDLVGGANVVLGIGDGGFGPSIPTGGASVVVADFNSDDRPDVAVTDYNKVSVLLNDGAWPDLNAPLLRIRDVTVIEGNTGTATAVFTVTLSAPSDQDVTVQYATADWTARAGSDYQAASGTLVIPAGETTGTITVLVDGDRLGETNETFGVNLSNATNANIADSQGVGTITDDEPRISISNVTMGEGRNGQTTLFTFEVMLSVAYDEAVTLSFSTVNWTAKAREDYVAKTGTLTFAPGEMTKTITIEVKGDNKREANECFFLDLFDNSSNSLFTKKRGIGTILNDD
jgi:hypothetical protein